MNSDVNALHERFNQSGIMMSGRGAIPVAAAAPAPAPPSPSFTVNEPCKKQPN